MTNKPLISATPARQRLELRVRNVLATEGALRRATVYCPLRERSVAFEECAGCERWAGLHVDQGRSYVACDVPADAAPPPAKNADANHTPVGEIMAKNIICVTPDTSARSVLSLFVNEGLSAVAVVDSEGHPIGVVSKTDLVRLAYERGDTADVEQRPPGRHLDASTLERGVHLEADDPPVRDLMTAIVLWIHERASIAQAAALMAYERVHQLPVVSDSRELVGFVSSLDLLRWMGQHTGYLIPAGHERRRD